jgi:hypothetical protein
VPGPTRYGEYDYEETKYVLKGQIDITVRSQSISKSVLRMILKHTG